MGVGAARRGRSASPGAAHRVRPDVPARSDIRCIGAGAGRGSRVPVRTGTALLWRRLLRAAGHPAARRLLLHATAPRR
ncbi:hypothetical protein ACFPM0_29290 [Pseudonocardia sulfidoxydans]|uniref:hypothetical protein n=1 Tax=Pseudonocardia sulfidoxydans TaxID=54011 RepID=UPI00360EB953